MDSKANFLLNILENNRLDSITISKENQKLSTMYGITFNSTDSEKFIFDFADVETKYIIEFDTIKSVLLNPFILKSIIVMLKDNITVELNFK